MEEEEYYDSIDDTEYPECRSFCNDKFFEDDSEIEEDNSQKVSHLVPFYNGNVEKSEIESIKNDSKSNSVTTFRASKLGRRASLMSLTDHRRNRSHLTMFYAKNGTTEKSEKVLADRATCSELSPKTDLLSTFDESASCCENANSCSMCNRFLEKDDNETCNTECNAFRCGSEVTLGSKLLSVSQANFNSLAPSKQRFKRETSKNRRSSQPIKLCELGGLGPNIAQEKLEQLRRRQDYGRTVSEKNRIKFMETKVVRKLRQEIRESNKF
ncbi:hypothetical protein HUJ04_010600 [Dendroctonus ponderosae]